jgi:hypothetical protein
MVYTVDLLGDANLRVRDLTITRNTYLANVVVDASADLNSVTTVGNTTTNSIEITSAQASTSKLTGALKVSGGVGVQGNVHVGSNLFVESNLEVGTANLFVDTTTGNVGIGTVSPGAPLEVHGSDLTGQPAGTTGILSRHVAGLDGVLNIFGIKAGNGEESLGIQTQIDRRAWQTDIDEGWNYGDSSRYDLSLQPYKGNVGIGTTNPNCLLTVEGGTGVGSSGGVLGIRQKGDTLNDGITLTSSNVNSTRMYKDVNGHFNLYNTGGGIFTLENLTGNVGIGMTNPNVKLDVSGIATFRSQPGFQAWKTAFELHDLIGTGGVLDGFTEQFDVNGDFNPTTGVFTAPEDGLYSFGINFSWDLGDGVDDTIWFLFEVDNNSTYGNRRSSTTEDFAMNPRFFSRSGTEYSTSHSTLERLESGATVNIYFHNVGDTGTNYIRTTNFFGYKVS